MGTLAETAKKYHCYILLKDSFCSIATPSGEVYVYDHPSSVAAQAGSGDLLAGMIAGFSSCGFSAFDAILKALEIFYRIIEDYSGNGYQVYDPGDFIAAIPEYLKVGGK